MEWSQSVKISLRSRGKFKYIIGTARPQLESDPKYEIWEAQNSMIMSWLLNSMQPEIRKTYLLLPTARDIWEAVNKTYSKVGFTSQIFQIKPQIMNTKQGTPSVTEYYNSLKGLLMELDIYQNIEMESAADSKKLKDMLEMERVFQFLLGLNPEFDQACEKILGKDLFLDLDEAFSHIHGEESRKELIGNKTENCGSLTTENSALAVAKQNQNASDNKKPVDKDKM